MNIIEKMARAICGSAYDLSNADTGGRDYFVDRHWSNHLENARAALMALREPTEAMVEAGVSEIECNCDITPGEFYRAWQAAITAALNDKG